VDLHGLTAPAVLLVSTDEVMNVLLLLHCVSPEIGPDTKSDPALRLPAYWGRSEVLGATPE